MSRAFAWRFQEPNQLDNGDLVDWMSLLVAPMAVHLNQKTVWIWASGTHNQQTIFWFGITSGSHSFQQNWDQLSSGSATVVTHCFLLLASLHPSILGPHQKTKCYQDYFIWPSQWWSFAAPCTQIGHFSKSVSATWASKASSTGEEEVTPSCQRKTSTTLETARKMQVKKARHQIWQKKTMNRIKSKLKWMK